ncbi:hypothetical protein GGR56DRAFT_50019 [Xylariaceae sp. FL0804]|nr:hypothetical protein GGR56DRAFT_50019 [Xylariaceae sp. FL0804]
MYRGYQLLVPPHLPLLSLGRPASSLVTCRGWLPRSLSSGTLLTFPGIRFDHPCTCPSIGPVTHSDSGPVRRPRRETPLGRSTSSQPHFLPSYVKLVTKTHANTPRHARHLLQPDTHMTPHRRPTSRPSRSQFVQYPPTSWQHQALRLASFHIVPS